MLTPSVRTQRRLRIAGCLACSVALGTLGLIAIAPIAALAPEPDPVPKRWELQVDPGELRVTTIDLKDGPKKFFYMTFHVTNNSGEDLLFAPSFQLSDGDGNVVRSGHDVPVAVTQKLLAETQNPFIQDQIGVIGELQQGEENAKDALVIWPAGSLNPSQLTVYAAGFSGETKTVTSPDGKEKFILRKTLRLDFQASGDLSGVGMRSFPLVERSWIMR
ncbi:MAG TPA: hypothetical protein VHC70_09405 [Phycisphaerales bacterium]|jgi:hypothetical protein|nr:hypothetical protein [Phycisphaerales bacterium]